MSERVTKRPSTGPLSTRSPHRNRTLEFLFQDRIARLRSTDGPVGRTHLRDRPRTRRARTSSPVSTRRVSTIHNISMPMYTDVRGNH